MVNAKVNKEDYNIQVQTAMVLTTTVVLVGNTQ